jgi:hypothetical protein
VSIELIFEPRLKDRRVSMTEAIDGVGIYVKAFNLVPEVCKAYGCSKAHIPEAYNSYK